MPRPKTDQEIQESWGKLQWEFKQWYDAEKENICRCSDPGADWDAFDQLVAKKFPKKEDQQAFDTWADEWLNRHFVRMTYRMKPEEFIDQVMATNFIDAQSTSDFLQSIFLNWMPWIPIGTAMYGGVETFYAFKPSTNFLQPDHQDPGQDVVGEYMLTMNLKSKARTVSGLMTASASSSVFNPNIKSTSDGEAVYAKAPPPTTSSIKENVNQTPGDDQYLVFAQIGTLHVYGGVCKDAVPENIPTINQGPWWSNGFAVVVELDKKGGHGAVYVVYNDCPLEDEDEEEQFEEYAGPSEEYITDTEGVAANHEPGKLHPECNQKFTVAKIADSLKRLGDLQTKFVFNEIAEDKRPINATKIVTDEVLGKFILHAKAPTQP